MNDEKPDEMGQRLETPPANTPRPPLLLLIGVLLGAVFMGLALFYTARGTREAHQATQQNEGAPLPEAIAVPTPDTTSAAGEATETEYSFTLFVPDENGNLVRREAGGKIVLPADAARARAVRAEHVVNNLLVAAPEDFPAGAKLLDAQASGPTVRLNFNDQFRQNDFWQGSARTMATIYALVNSVTASVPDTKSVQFLVNGKPVELLGEMAADEPFEPKPEMVMSP